MKKAFSLIELIVGITISMLLMVSVGVFISSGMQNIFAGQKVLENIDDFSSFADNLNKNISLIESGSFAPTSTSSGIIFKRGQNFSEGGFSYIGTQIIDGIYCGSGSENTKTNNLFIKSFIPFEEQSEDIFTDYNSILTSKNINIGAIKYKSFQKENVIKEDDGTIIVGKGVFGDKFIEGANGKDIYLNSPTGLETDGTNLYISDTLNNRILYLDNSNNIHLLLDEFDGLNEPTGLYYNDNSLYISNSGNGEILKYSSKNESINKYLNIAGINTNLINKIQLEFYNPDGTNKNIAGPSNKNDITFTNATKYDDYLGTSGNKLNYFFVNYTGPNYSEISCNGTEERLVGGNPVKCISIGTGQTSTYIDTDLINESINIQNIIPNFAGTGSYYVNLKLFNGVTQKYSNYFPFYTQSDNDLTTKLDNTLTKLFTGLNYPTGIWGTGATDFNVFGDGTYIDIPYHNTDNLLNIPIKSLDISNIPNDLLSFILKYYKTYNCFNNDEKIDKTFIIKKNLK